MTPIERSGLIATDVEVLRLHYAETLWHWRRRFSANRDAIAALYDDRFCRMFEFYLAGSELAFRHQDHVNFQVQITREQTAAPLARDYITDSERQMMRTQTADRRTAGPAARIFGGVYSSPVPVRLSGRAEAGPRDGGVRRRRDGADLRRPRVQRRRVHRLPAPAGGRQGVRGRHRVRRTRLEAPHRRPGRRDGADQRDARRAAGAGGPGRDRRRLDAAAEHSARRPAAAGGGGGGSSRWSSRTTRPTRRCSARGVLPADAVPAVLDAVRADAAAAGFEVLGVVDSPIKGAKGNAEALALLRVA